MAYFSSSAPLPQNSLMPPPAGEAARSNARVARNAQFSSEGRERFYANMPTAESLASLGLGLPVSADENITASETARQAILIGVGTPDPTATLADTLGAIVGQLDSDVQTIINSAPVNLALNGTQGVPPSASTSSTVSPSGLVTTTPTMPQAAPVPFGGVYLDPAPAIRPKIVFAKIRARDPGGSCSINLPAGRGGNSPAWGDAAVSGGVSGGGLILAGILAGAVLLLGKAGRGR